MRRMKTVNEYLQPPKKEIIIIHFMVNRLDKNYFVSVYILEIKLSVIYT